MVDFLSMSSPILFLRFRFFLLFFFVVSEVLSFMLVVLLIFFFFFFPGPRSGACSVSDPGLLAKFVNKINIYFE